MMKRTVLIVVALSLLASCSVFKKSSDGVTQDLTAIASRVKETTYTAVYTFGYTGPLAPAVRTRLEIVQQPPRSLRRLDTTTPARDNKKATVSSWLVKGTDTSYACTDEYAGRQIRCLADPIESGTFGNDQVDQFFDDPREPNAFASVRKMNRSVRVHGETAICYEAVPNPPAEPAVTSPQPQITPEHLRFELCYASDGILLRGRRTIIQEGGTGERQAVLEIVSVSRVVERNELKLPGPVASAEELR